MERFSAKFPRFTFSADVHIVQLVRVYLERVLVSLHSVQSPPILPVTMSQCLFATSQT